MSDKNNEVANENSTKKCPYCGEEVLLEAKKCKHCGEFLDKDLRNSKVDFKYSVGSIFLLIYMGIIRFITGFGYMGIFEMGLFGFWEFIALVLMIIAFYGAELYIFKKSTPSWMSGFDWKIFFFIFVGYTVIYNFFLIPPEILMGVSKFANFLLSAIMSIGLYIVLYIYAFGQEKQK